MERFMQHDSLSWENTVLSGISFCDFLLRETGNSPGCGFIFQVDDPRQAQRFGCLLHEHLGAVDVKTLSSRMCCPPNFRLGYFIYNTLVSEPQVLEYLGRNDFFPILISGGLIPEALKTEAFIFRSDVGSFEEKIEDFSVLLREFKIFYIDHVNELIETLNSVKSSRALTEADIEPELSGAYRGIISVGLLWKNFLRKISTEAETEKFWQFFLKETQERIRKVTEFADGIEIEEMLRKLLWQFLEEHSDISICDIDEVDGQAESAVRQAKAILFDDEFYYFPEPLFKTIIRPLLDSVNLTTVKMLLKNIGILECNKAEYTVKKLYTNVFGAKRRIRVMKFRKDFLYSEEQLSIEDSLSEATELQPLI